VESKKIDKEKIEKAKKARTKAVKNGQKINKDVKN